MAALNIFKILPLATPQDTPDPAAAHAEVQLKPVKSDQIGVALLACRIELPCVPLAPPSSILNPHSSREKSERCACGYHTGKYH